jgi:hypothetical protein
MNTLNIIGWLLLSIGWILYIIPFREPLHRLVLQATMFGLAAIIFITNLIINF